MMVNAFQCFGFVLALVGSSGQPAGTAGRGGLISLIGIMGESGGATLLVLTRWRSASLSRSLWLSASTSRACSCASVFLDTTDFTYVDLSQNGRQKGHKGRRACSCA
jgi:hypothetical protein